MKPTSEKSATVLLATSSLLDRRQQRFLKRPRGGCLAWMENQMDAARWLSVEVYRFAYNQQLGAGPAAPGRRAMPMPVLPPPAGCTQSDKLKKQTAAIPRVHLILMIRLRVEPPLSAFAAHFLCSA